MRKIIAALALVAAMTAPAVADTVNLSPGQLNYILSQNGTASAVSVPGISPIGSPTFVSPPNEEHGQLIDIGQAFGQAAAPYINAIVQALIAALISWVLVYIKKKTGIAIDAGHRDALITALQNQAGSLIADGMVKIENGKVTIPDGVVAKAATDALRSIPDAAAHLGLTPDYVAKRIIDTIPQIAAGAQLLAQAQAATKPVPAPDPGIRAQS